jgi:hypothetical protein
MQNELVAWIKVIVIFVLIIGIPIFIGVINANYEGDNNDK